MKIKSILTIELIPKILLKRLRILFTKQQKNAYQNHRRMLHNLRSIGLIMIVKLSLETIVQLKTKFGKQTKIQTHSQYFIRKFSELGVPGKLSLGYGEKNQWKLELQCLGHLNYIGIKTLPQRKILQTHQQIRAPKTRSYANYDECFQKTKPKEEKRTLTVDFDSSANYNLETLFYR